MELKVEKTGVTRTFECVVKEKVLGICSYFIMLSSVNLFDTKNSSTLNR